MLQQPRDSRFARRAAREMGGLIGFLPRVGLDDSANPGLDDTTPSVLLFLPRVARTMGIEISEDKFPDR